MTAPEKNHVLLTEKTVPALRYREGDDFPAWQISAREKLAELLGMDTFVPCPLALETEWVRHEEGFTEYRLHYDTEENFRTLAHLAIPDGATGPIPALICLQGHNRGLHRAFGRRRFPDEEVDEEDRDFAIQCLKNGYAALAVEQRCFGENGGDPDPNCAQTAHTALLLGRTLIAERVWDVMRSIDMLEAHFPQIDLDRLGLMGHSGGGTATIYAAALEPRIKAAMPICSLCGFKESIVELEHCACNYVPGILRFFDMGDIAGLIAPRPLTVVNGSEDPIFPIDSAHREFARAQRLYALAGGSCAHVVGQGEHRAYAADSWPVFNRLTGWDR